MIALENATTFGSKGRLALGPVSLSFGKGAHALVGPGAEGGPLLLAALAGAMRLRSGRALIDERPATSRPDVAWVPLPSELPRSLTVEEVLATGQALRGGSARGQGASTAPAAQLERFGISALSKRRVATLSLEEVHTVALVEALTSNTSVLLLEEPLCRIDARAASPLVEALRERARDGACLLVATASERDARALSATMFVVRGGLCVRRDEPGHGDLSRLAGLRIVGPDLRPLAELLTGNVHAQTIAWEGSALMVRGSDGLGLATAVSRAIASSGVDVEVLEPLQPLVQRSVRPPHRVAESESAPAGSGAEESRES